MILDERTEFADAATITTATGAHIIGDVIDIGLPGARPGVAGSGTKDLGNGQPVYCVVTIDTAVTSAGAATVDFAIYSHTTATITSGASAVATGAIGKATLVAGYTHILTLPAGVELNQYVGLVATVGTAALTAGKVNAFLTLDPHGNTSQPDAVIALS
jgi:hypothetical protein